MSIYSCMNMIFKLLCTTLLVTQACVNACSILKEINGCSTPLRLPAPFKQDFAPACNIHDICYNCGEKYNWPQLDCDESFKKKMYSICNNTVLGKIVNGYSFDYSKPWKDLKDSILKIYEGYKKVTQNKTSTEEASRLWRATQVLVKMTAKWPFIRDPLQRCQHGADIYHKTVRSFGIYFYRVKAKDVCNEACAEKLGKPFS